MTHSGQFIHTVMVTRQPEIGRRAGKSAGQRTDFLTTELRRQQQNAVFENTAVTAARSVRKRTELAKL